MAYQFYRVWALLFNKLYFSYILRYQPIPFINSLVVLFPNVLSNINNKFTLIVSIILFLLFISYTNVDCLFDFSYLFYSILDCFILLLNEVKKSLYIKLYENYKINIDKFYSCYLKIYFKYS